MDKQRNGISPQLTLPHFQDCLPTVITSRKIKLETRGWSQIVEEKEILSGLMRLLNYDSPLLVALHVQAKKQLKTS